MADDADHERYVRRAIELAEEAAAAGDRPFGTLLERDGEVLAESRNTVVTDSDVTAHPELKLARWAARELDADALAATTMYTSTEPCAMCATALYNAGLRRVYSTGATELASLAEPGLTLPSERVFDHAEEEVTVVGGVLARAGRAVHESFW
ncbi:nucleoside deaminase [Halomarina ordinaria]|uniref:Nucleoside deaminase n=1 Tax=Halomarina ordinaria TaxID=3033939 RepID=A0ABD5UED7_9EURY|nr:nucleoside deaminase [Halomarina sp. PSRA2]